MPTASPSLSAPEAPSAPFATLPLSRFRFRLAPESALHLSSVPGSTLRGALGTLLKRVVCITGREECAGCPVHEQCAFGQLYEPQRQRSTGALPPRARSYTRPPRPYVLRFPDPPRQHYAPGEPLRFDLVLAGDAGSYLPHLAAALRALEESGLGKGRNEGEGQFHLARVTALHNDARAVLLDGPDDALTAPPPPVPLGQLTDAPPAGRELELRFVTPLRLKHRGDWLREPTPAALGKALARRVAAFGAFYASSADDAASGAPATGDGAPPSSEALDEAAEALTDDGVETERSRFEWTRQFRYSGRQHRRIPMSGATGRLVLGGDWPRAWPLLSAGAVLGAGKSCTMGLGQYRLRAL